MTFTVVVDENMPAVEDFLDPAFSVRRMPGRGLTTAAVADADALLVRSVTRVDEQLLAASPVRFVGSATSGVDHVDREFLTTRHIPFAYAPGANANSVVEYVLAGIGAVGEFLECLLNGGRVGVVGYGHVGKALVGRLRALGIAYRVSDPWLDTDSVPGAATLAEVLSCDVISLHPELTDASPWPSYHLLAQRELASLGPGQLLINASRGAVIDNVALLQRLQKGAAPVVVLDVWEGEPDFDPQLLQQVAIGTPHIAGYSLDSKRLASAMVCRQLSRHFGLPQPPVAVASDAGLLQPSPDKSGASLLRELLCRRYDILEDDRRLRSLLGDRAAGFDRLRKQYPERRELSGSRVQVTQVDARDRELLAALGCHCVDTTTETGDV